MDLIQQGKDLAQEGNFAEALGVFKKVLETDPRNADVLFFIGTCHSSLGDFPAAKYYYQEVLNIDPNHSRTQMVWNGLDDVEARPPSDARPSKPPEPEAEPVPPVEEESQPDPMDQVGAGRSDEFEDKWANAFPEDQFLQAAPSKSGVAVWIWVVIVLVVAGLVYFWLGPTFLK